MHQIKEFIDQLIQVSTPTKPVWNQEAILENKPPHWSYIDGCMLMAVEKMYEVTGEENYAEFLDEFVDYYVDDEGGILGFQLAEMNSDAINEGKLLFPLYQRTGKAKYRQAIDTLMDQVRQMPQTATGSFWHKAIYPNQVWLDGLYMVEPFFSAYELTYGDGSQLPVILRQFENVQKFMKDAQTGLFYHAYDDSREAFWCDKKTGLSQCFWSRSIGWYAMALVDTWELLAPDQQSAAEVLAADFQDLMAALLKYQDPETKLFYQVTDQGQRQGNYLETSASCAIAYTLMKGARLGILPTTDFDKGQEILAAVVSEKLSQVEGQWQLKDICLVAGVGGMNGKGNYPTRDGSYAYYISEPRVVNDAKGIGPLVYAYSEYLRK